MCNQQLLLEQQLLLWVACKVLQVTNKNKHSINTNNKPHKPSINTRCRRMRNLQRAYQEQIKANEAAANRAYIAGRRKLQTDYEKAAPHCLQRLLINKLKARRDVAPASGRTQVESHCSSC